MALGRVLPAPAPSGAPGGPGLVAAALRPLPPSSPAPPLRPGPWSFMRTCPNPEGPPLQVLASAASARPPFRASSHPEVLGRYDLRGDAVHPGTDPQEGRARVLLCVSRSQEGAPPGQSGRLLTPLGPRGLWNARAPVTPDVSPRRKSDRRGVRKHEKEPGQPRKPAGWGRARLRGIGKGNRGRSIAPGALGRTLTESLGTGTARGDQPGTPA